MSLRLLLSLVLLLGLGSSALGQPMMPDPSAMSGIPRPEAGVPSGTITVRLLIGTFANPLVNHDVTLTATTGVKQTAKSDASGRATFSGLQPGAYVASTELSGIVKSSQPIPVQGPPAPGLRVMLVFPKDTPVPPVGATSQAGSTGSAASTAAASPSAVTAPVEVTTPAPPADGQVHAESALAAGTLKIFVVDEANKPLPGVPVTLYRRLSSEAQVEKLPAQMTGLAGATQWLGMPTGAAEYLVTISRFGFEQPSEPFHLDGAMGTTLSVISRPPVSGDEARRKLSLSSGSHLIFELQEDLVQVSEILRINNPMPQAFDPGSDGLRIPLPEGAVSPQLQPGGPSTLSIDQSSPGNVALVWKGPLPPGESMVQLHFLLRHTGELQFKQPATLQVADLRVVIEKRPELKIDGVTDIQDRKWQGHDLLFAQLPGTGEGGMIALTISGLPAEHRMTRLVGGALALLIALGFIYLSWQSSSGDERTQVLAQRKLLRDRDKLLDELLSIDDKKAAADDKKAAAKRPREQVMTELTAIYRQLDEANAD